MRGVHASVTGGGKRSCCAGCRVQVKDELAVLTGKFVSALYSSCAEIAMVGWRFVGGEMMIEVVNR